MHFLVELFGLLMVEISPSNPKQLYGNDPRITVVYCSTSLSRSGLVAPRPEPDMPKENSSDYELQKGTA